MNYKNIGSLYIIPALWSRILDSSIIIWIEFYNINL